MKAHTNITNAAKTVISALVTYKWELTGIPQVEGIKL
jgi:hypothetical protein